MYEWKPKEKSQREQTDLEKRLSAFYGPELREQPLPASSWLRLRSKLGAQPSSSRRWRMPHFHIHQRIHRRTPPAYISTAFVHIAHEARLPWTSPLLYCTFKAKVRI